MSQVHASSARPGHPAVITTEKPPESPGQIIRRLGPGLVIAASIVGSGELIATTKTGADAGYSLLWLILIGCVIKVFVQVEFGRFALTEGRTSLEGMNLLPGPRLRVNWLVWYWLFMFTAGLGQLGGIVGGVGQSLAMAVPLTGDFVEQLAGSIDAEVYTYDDVYWSLIVTAVTAVLLVNGRYGWIQAIATVFVATFTLMTIFNVCALPYFSTARIGWDEIRQGLSFGLPKTPPGSEVNPLATALFTFGIIGVGASELVMYPYWCLEKGYARFTGPRDDSSAWVQRARGWLRVMRWDAWCSMVVYTFATVAFYVLGAAVLNPLGVTPGGNKMVHTLARMYHDVFSPWGDLVFLFGAFAVLYSTFFVATAGNSRLATDALRLFRLRENTEASRLRWVRLFCGLFPFISLAIFTAHKNPVKLVLFSALAQAVMLPMLGIAALYFRYRRCDRRITPGKLWDLMLCISVVGLLVTGTWAAKSAVEELASKWKQAPASARAPSSTAGPEGRPKNKSGI